MLNAFWRRGDVDVLLQLKRDSDLIEDKNRCNAKPSRKGTGFVQPLAAHDHWHIDVAHLNVAGTFYYLCALLGG
ncbi:MAG: hypothetical protein MJE77_39255 [Proteobacteria bacterium]|nr:hypothetical protein [Pseudomonadota bacterium]